MDISPNPSKRILRKRKQTEETWEMEVEESHANIEGELTVPVRGKNKVSKRKSIATRQRVRNLKVLNSPSRDEEESVVDDDEVSVIAKEVYDACVPPSREHSPVPMYTIPPTTSSPPKIASPPLLKPQNTPLPPPTKSPPSPVPKEKKPAVVPISEEHPDVPDLKEQPSATNPPNTSSYSSQSPTIGATYTLAHARRLDYLFTLVMGHSEAMMKFANEDKGVNGLVQGLMSKVDKALNGQKFIMENLVI
ncbi:uncharacterized protein LOC125496575 [Beta vulgaris subsp. vulgaris]|uniref:uncharacterized protein LOC125496575 n=1 Tax=Beta vulgaris subsp. vulgaris TaxID=3555 RepID=UPI0020374165|nr:uncharacterized protein LOC125496575 [Beta vulgaris subsp. vulgaris]